jgi:GDP/UDP-N,N'-diacetylbacillosamine 2-epimerase (hydrolysing)
MKRICVVTTSRADYGLLYWTIKGIQSSSKLDLILVAGGLHLVKEIGYSLQNILNDGLNPIETIDLEMSSDSENGIAHSMGLGIEKFTNCFAKFKPDLVLLLGDRFETLSAACAATICHIPVAHCHGGEVTEGAFDESFRHSITKMSQIHFTSSENHKKRVRQLGENPKNIHVVGALGIENIIKLKLLSKEEIESSLNLQFKESNFLVTFHPTTLELDETESQFINLIKAFKQFNYAQIILTKPNNSLTPFMEDIALDIPQGLRALVFLRMSFVCYVARRKLK